MRALIRWPGRDSRGPGFDWAAHELRAGALVTDLRSLSRQGYRYLREDNESRAGWLARVRQLSPEAVTSLLLLFVRQAADEDGRWSGDTDWGLRRIDPRKCAVTDDEAACALRTAVTMADTFAAGVVLSKALSMAVQARPGTGAGLRSAIQEVAHSIAQWRKLYPAHPVTGPLARRLLWTVQDDGTETGLPGPDGKLATLDGERDIPPAATVRLWHPARAGTAQVQAWRDRLVRDELAQPFKQAFREVYLLTPAERETRLYSNRFATHILHYRQVYALTKTRAWVANYLGPHDGGYEGNARRDFADAGLTAVFSHYPADTGPNAWEVELCSTDRVAFPRTEDRARRPVPLDAVPDLVFSEAMRDVDLFVGVASIALDPAWIDRRGAGYVDYWRAFSFGELSETARTRRDALGRIVPKLKIAGRLELGDRFLRVHGRLNTYKIHLGSANIQIEPDDRYLCIVPGGGPRSSKVMLPFEGDQVLSVILSKAVLLAADDKITDEPILQQLRRRPEGSPRARREDKTP